MPYYMLYFDGKPSRATYDDSAESAKAYDVANSVGEGGAPIDPDRVTVEEVRAAGLVEGQNDEFWQWLKEQLRFDGDDLCFDEQGELLDREIWEKRVIRQLNQCIADGEDMLVYSVPRRDDDYYDFYASEIRWETINNRNT